MTQVLGVGLGAWSLLLRRAFRARRPMMVMIAVLTFTAVFPVALASTVAQSSTPLGGELTSRLLGPYDMRVQGDDAADARALAAAAGEDATSTTILVTPANLVTATHATTGSLEVGRPLDGYWQSRFDTLSGHYPAAPTEVVLSQTLATVMGLTPGSRVTIAGAPLTISGIVRERSAHSSRLALRFEDPSAVSPGDAALTSWNVFVHAKDGAAAAEVQEQYLREGYGVLSHAGGDTDALVSDGEFARLIRVVSWGLLAWGAGLMAVLASLLARALRRDLSMVAGIGFSPLNLAALLVALIGIVAIPTTLLAAATGVGVAALLRSTLETIANTSWYALRVDPTVFGGSAILLAVSVLLATMLTTHRHRIRAARRWNAVRAARGFGLGGAVVVAVSIATGRWTYLLAAALLLGPWLAMVGWAGVQRIAAVRAHRAQTGLDGQLIWGSVRHHAPVGAAMAALTAGFVVAPLMLGLVLAGLSGAPRQEAALVPRPTVALYTGGGDFGAAELRAAGAEAGAERVAVWSLASIPTQLEEGSVQLPALPAKGADACRAQMRGGQVSAESDLCAPALRGVGLADEDTLAAVLGRTLSSDERAFFRNGGALVTDERMAAGARVEVSPLQAPPGAPKPVALSARAVALATGTSPSPLLPTVWISTAARPTLGVGAGQSQAAFEFASAVTPDAEQRLRYALVTRLPVANGEEFLVTHLNATQVNLVQRLLGRSPVVAVVLVLLAAVIGGLMFRRVHGRQVSVLQDLGVGNRTVRLWHGVELSGAALVGSLAAAIVAALTAWATVRGEVGTDMSLSQVGALWPLATAPLIVLAVGFLWPPRTRRSAWVTAFGEDV